MSEEYGKSSGSLDAGVEGVGEGRGELPPVARVAGSDGSFDRTAYAAIKKVAEWHGAPVPSELPDGIPVFLKGKIGFLVAVLLPIVAAIYVYFAQRREFEEDGIPPDKVILK